MGFSAFRRAQQTAATMKPQGDGFDPWSAKNMQLENDESALIRVLDPGDNFYVTRSHWRGGSRTCTSELPGFGGRCVYCYYQEKAEKGSKDKSDLWPRVSTVVELIDFRYFHRVKEKGKDGKERNVFARCASDDAVPKFVRGRSCPHCQSNDPIVRERHFGGHKKWELSDDNFDQIRAVDDKLAEICVHIDDDGKICGKQVFVVGFACSECGEPLLDEKTLTAMGDDQIADFAYNDQKCPKCKHEGWPKEVCVCESEAHEAVRGSIFGKTLEVTCSGHVTIDKRGKEKKTKKYNFDRSRAFSSVEDELVAHGYTGDKLGELLEPWDFRHEYRPEFLDPAKYDDEAAYVAAVFEAQTKNMGQGFSNPYKSESSGGSTGGGERRSVSFGRRR